MSKSQIFYQEGNPLHVRANLRDGGNFNIGGAIRGDDVLGEKITMRLLAYNHFTGVMFPTLNEGQTLEDKRQEKFEVFYIDEQGIVCCILVAGSYSPSAFRQAVLRPRMNPATGELCKLHELTVTASLVPKEKPGQKFSILKFEVAIAEPDEVESRAEFLETNNLFSYEMTAEKLRHAQYYTFSRSINTFDPIEIKAIDNSSSTLTIE